MKNFGGKAYEFHSSDHSMIISSETCVVGVNITHALAKLMLIEEVLEWEIPRTVLMTISGY